MTHTVAPGSRMFRRLLAALVPIGLMMGMVLLVACERGGPCIPSHDGVYREAAGILHPSVETFSGVRWRLQPGSASGTALPLESALTDCSTAEFICLQRALDGAVLAVPRERPPAATRFTLSGATVDYRGCFAEAGTPCRIEEYVVAWGDVASDPAAQALEESNSGDVNEDEFRQRLVFRYDRRRGVMAYLQLALGQPLGPFDPTGAAAFDMTHSSFYILEGSHGILRCSP